MTSGLERGKQGQHQWEEVIRPVVGFFLVENGHGVGHLHESEAWKPPRGRHGGARLTEGLGHEGDPRDAPLLEHQRVEHTARAARPSVADTRDHEVRDAAQLVGRFLGDGVTG